MSGTGQNGQGYRVFATTNIALPFSTWMPMSAYAFNGGVFDFTDPNAAIQPQRFYRVTSS